MTDKMEITTTPDQAAAITGSARDAMRRARDVTELEYALLRARDQLRVVIGALEDFAQGETVQGMTERESSIIFGATWTLEDIADACDAAFTGLK